ncbi:DUF3325 domain-containing protein [Shewanella sp. cp20]|uniref:DUF3325 domain-containing protein n=1 Tax=Shewanella sp. cp20 TaxID=1521167 RepID=UPI0005A2FED9|nr:DUF3325 domain-containing protein [Shewanella sp. cp20]KIO36303.1 hypothetical protein DB48_12295 [Shewanella sp. cp20]
MILALCLGVIAFGLMALSMFGHYKDCFGRAPTRAEQRWLTGFAWLLLLGSYGQCIHYYHLGYGSIVFFGVMTITALSTILLLSYQAKRLPLVLTLTSVFSLVFGGSGLIA